MITEISELLEPPVDKRDSLQARPGRLVGQAATPADDIIDLTHLARTWLRWIWVPILMSLGGVYFGYQDLKSFMPNAVATMIVLPTAASASGPSVAVGGGVAAIAAQFGVRVGAVAAASVFDRLKLTLSSLELAGELQQKYGLLQRLYPTSWDAQTQTWIRPSGEEFERQERRRTFLRQNLWMPPSLESLSGFIGGALKFEEISIEGFKRVSVTHPDPDFALWLLSTAFFEADDLLRVTDRRQSAENRAYIERQLQRSTLVEILAVLRGLLSQELSRSVGLESELLYAATIIEAPHVLNRRTEPNLLRLLGVPMIGLGAIGFALITFLALFWRR